MSAIGTKRTLRDVRLMSAFGGKADTDPHAGRALIGDMHDVDNDLVRLTSSPHGGAKTSIYDNLLCGNVRSGF
jgi:hypothetical protein